MSRGVQKTVETNIEKIGVAKTEEGRDKRERKQERKKKKERKRGNKGRKKQWK